MVRGCNVKRRPAPASAVPLLLFVLGVLTSGCAATTAPILSPARELAGLSLVLRPEVRLGNVAGESGDEELVALLAAELRRTLADQGVVASGPTGQPAIELARLEVLDAWRHERGLRGSRLPEGTPIVADEALQVLRASGAETVLMTLLSRRGLTAPEGEYVPRPSGELYVLPEERNDYEIPTADEFASDSLVLELLVVRTGDGRVVQDRRAAEPSQGRDPGSLVPRLVRLVVRGLGGPR